MKIDPKIIEILTRDEEKLQQSFIQSIARDASLLAMLATVKVVAVALFTIPILGFLLDIALGFELGLFKAIIMIVKFFEGG